MEFDVSMRYEENNMEVYAFKIFEMGVQGLLISCLPLLGFEIVIDNRIT